jgi:hypothetical protein
MGLNSCRLDLGLERPVASRPSPWPGPRSLPFGWGRNSCRGGSRVRMVTGSPSMALEDAHEVLALHGQDLGQGFFAALQGRPGSSRAPRRCGRPQRTCARCGSGRCPRRRSPGHLASWGVSALVRTPRVRNSSTQLHELAEVAGELGLHLGHLAQVDLALGAVQGDPVAFFDGEAAAGELTGL